MENEIDLKDIFQVLWRGKYFILAVTALFALAAVLYTSFLITPAYEYSAYLDLGPLQVNGKEAIAIIQQNRVVARSVKGMAGDLDLLERSIEVNLLPDNISVLLIKVSYPDPEICVSSVRKTGEAIIKAVYDYRFNQLFQEKDKNEKILAYLDESTAEYLLSRDEKIIDLLEEDPLYKRLLEEKAERLVQLKLINFDLEEINRSTATGDNIWITDNEGEVQLTYTNKKAYIAVAVLLGLLLSVFALYFRYNFISDESTDHDEPGVNIVKNK